VITCLSVDFTAAESFDFQRIIPRKGMPFRGIIRGKFRLSTDNPRKVKRCARISPQNSRKNIKLLLDIHQGHIRCCLMKKNEAKNLMLQFL
jgi:hypothetical protein